MTDSTLLQREHDLLKGMEWSGYPLQGYPKDSCPVCGGLKTADMWCRHWAGHRKDCCLSDLINKVEREIKMASRQQVYEAINSERDYQDNLPRSTVKNQMPMEHLAIIERICRDMNDCWYDKPGQPTMDFMRKIAATAVRCMEQHGAPRRE
jgi:predicted component of type VI protein secretion system